MNKYALGHGIGVTMFDCAGLDKVNFNTRKDVYLHVMKGRMPTGIDTNGITGTDSASLPTAKEPVFFHVVVYVLSAVDKRGRVLTLQRVKEHEVLCRFVAQAAARIGSRVMLAVTKTDCVRPADESELVRSLELVWGWLKLDVVNGECALSFPIQSYDYDDTSKPLDETREFGKELTALRLLLEASRYSQRRRNLPDNFTANIIMDAVRQEMEQESALRMAAGAAAQAPSVRTGSVSGQGDNDEMVV